MKPLLVAGMLAVVLLAMAPSGQAEALGPCEGVVGGESVTTDGQRITVPANGSLDYMFSAEQPVRSWRIDMSFGIGSATISEGTSDSNKTSTQGTADVGKYAQWGAGAYRIDATVHLADGQECTGSFLIDVTTNPLTTVVGWVAIAAGAGGAAIAGGASIAGAKAALAALRP